MRLHSLCLPLLAGLVALIPTIATLMLPVDTQNSCNSLARMAFDVKDLVLAISSSKNGAGLQDVFDEMTDLFDTVLTNVELIIGSAVITSPSDQQLVYEAYSNFVEGNFELMDALSSSAATFNALDKQNEFRVPAAVRQLSGVIDALLFELTGLFPSNSSYARQAANQHAQVDTHFRAAVHAFHLTTAQSGDPYGNATTLPMRRS